MPLESYSAREALSRVRDNPNRRPTPRDPRRSTRTLDLPIHPTFRISKGDSIFTVGSCFARNIESVFKEFDAFRLPALEIPPDVLSITQWNTGALNKYTLPAIANEIRWAFDDFDGLGLETALFNASDTETWDSQMFSSPGDLPTYAGASARRHAVNASYRSLTDCDVLVLTLGLVEAWRSLEHGFYCNAAPPPRLLRHDGFELCLLSFEDCLQSGRYIMRKVFEVNPDINVLLTVSPVTLYTTFSAEPIIVRNCYSKSVLRATAEHLRYEFPKIDYFPSYERVIYAERETAFRDDEIHPTKSIINHTVISMLSAYVDAKLEDLPKGAFRMWWKAAFERDTATAEGLFSTYSGQILESAPEYPEAARLLAETHHQF